MARRYIVFEFVLNDLAITTLSAKLVLIAFIHISWMFQHFYSQNHLINLWKYSIWIQFRKSSFEKFHCSYETFQRLLSNNDCHLCENINVDLKVVCALKAEHCFKVHRQMACGHLELFRFAFEVGRNKSCTLALSFVLYCMFNGLQQVQNEGWQKQWQHFITNIMNAKTNMQMNDFFLRDNWAEWIVYSDFNSVCFMMFVWHKHANDPQSF